MSQLIAIIDYGSGNIHSVQKALEFVSPNSHIIHTDNVKIIKDADRIVFPGQGAMGSCMNKIRKHHLLDTINEVVTTKPFLGICVGLHMLFDYSEEQDSKGIGVFNGSIKKFSNKVIVPHIGWNTVKQTNHPLWHNIEDNSYFYSVHSYYAPLSDITHGSTYYGVEFSSAIAKDNIFAVQFHPEKSSDNGLQLLKNFVNWKV